MARREVVGARNLPARAQGALEGKSDLFEMTTKQENTDVATLILEPGGNIARSRA